MNKLFDIKFIIKNTPNMHKLKIKLAHIKNKGIGIISQKNIKEDELIAYYKVTVFKEKGYKSPTNFKYAIEIRTKRDRHSKTFLGDVTSDSLSPPCKNVPYWGYLLNEPSGKQKPNCYIDPNLKENYDKRTLLKEGDVFIYKIRAMFDIKAGEELTWYYGSAYERDYDINL